MYLDQLEGGCKVSWDLLLDLFLLEFQIPSYRNIDWAPETIDLT